MNLFIGLGIALVLAWVFIQLGNMLRGRMGGGLSRFAALAVGVGVGLAIWALLRWGTSIPTEIIDALGIGPAVGLSQSLRRPEESKGK